MLYFSSEDKMEGPKVGAQNKSGGANFFFAPELGPLTSNLLPTPINLQRL